MLQGSQLSSAHLFLLLPFFLRLKLPDEVEDTSGDDRDTTAPIAGSMIDVAETADGSADTEDNAPDTEDLIDTIVSAEGVMLEILLTIDIEACLVNPGSVSVRVDDLRLWLAFILNFFTGMSPFANKLEIPLLKDGKVLVTLLLVIFPLLG